MAPLKLFVFVAMVGTAYVEAAGPTYTATAWDTNMVLECSTTVNDIKTWTAGVGGGCPTPTATSVAAFGKQLKSSVVNEQRKYLNAERKFDIKRNKLKKSKDQDKWTEKLKKKLERRFKGKTYQKKDAGVPGTSPIGNCEDPAGPVLFEIPDDAIILKDCEKIFKIYTSALKSVYEDDYDSSCWTMIIISVVVVFAVLIAVIMMFCKSSNADD